MKSRTIAAVRFTADGQFSEIELPAANVVAGLYAEIDCTQVNRILLDDGLMLWADEEGHRKGLRVNLLAMYLANVKRGLSQLFVGTIVLTGGDDNVGNSVGISPETVAKLREITGIPA